MEPGPVTWRARTGSLVLAGLATSGILTLGLLLAFDGATRSDTIAGVVMLPVAVTGFWLFGLRPHIRIADGELFVQNPTRHLRVALEQVTAVRPSSSGLVIDVNWNRAVTAWAVQKSPLADWTGRKVRADIVAQNLMSAAKGSPPP